MTTENQNIEGFKPGVVPHALQKQSIRDYKFLFLFKITKIKTIIN